MILSMSISPSPAQLIMRWAIALRIVSSGMQPLWSTAKREQAMSKAVASVSIIAGSKLWGEFWNMRGSWIWGLSNAAVAGVFGKDVVDAFGLVA